MIKTKVIEIYRAIRPSSCIKVYATVASRTFAQKVYRVVYIRSKTFRGWLCQCDDFLFRKFPAHRNCQHIRDIRQKYGRFAAKLPKDA